MQRLETEARTISKLVNGETKNLWPPIIDGVTVAKGYEKALGAVLGDDLDAPVDPSAPMRWTNAGATVDDPALPDGVEALAAHVQAPAELARRLAQIGVVRQGARRGTGVATEDRPAAGVAGRRRLALGRFCRGRPRPDRRRAASRRTRPACRYRTRAGAGPHRRRRQAAGAGRRRGRTEGGVRRRVRRPRGLACRAARGRCRARTPCRDRARDQPPRRAQIGADRSPHPPRRRSQRGRGRARERHCRAGRTAAEPRHRNQARRRSHRHRRPSPVRRASARRSAGAGARGRTRRPPRAGDPRRAHRMAEPQAERGLAGRHRRGPHHRSHRRARRA